MGVTPQCEVWGFSKSLTRLSETAFAAIDSGHPSACVLPDIYHLHKGGSGFETFKLLSGVAVHMFHVNDYPALPNRASINDSHRVYPGDGVAPLKQIVRDLSAAGFRVRTPQTEQQKQIYTALPAYQVERATVKGKTFYVYKDEKAGVAYVGHEQEYQSYRNLCIQQQVAQNYYTAVQMDRMSAYRWYGGWGARGMYW